MDIELKQARIADAEEVLALQKLAFQSESPAYSRCTIPPLAETLERITKELKDKRVLKAMNGEKIVGSVRAYRWEGTRYLEKLVVHPSFQGKGIGTRLMQEMEKLFADRVERIQLSTDYKNERNVFMYKKLGYKIYKTQKLSNDEGFVYMEKYTKGSPA
ncbi:MAG: GNAT family N-acetyltransferase [Candidatus Omnitrophota bacterium]